MTMQALLFTEVVVALKVVLFAELVEAEQVPLFIEAFWRLKLCCSRMLGW
jgi:hypothetical protein